MSIFDSLKKTHKKIKQMEKAKALDSIQRNEVFIIEEDEPQKKVMYVASNIRNPQDKKKGTESDSEDESESDSENKGAFKEELAYMIFKVNTFKRLVLDSELDSNYDEVFSISLFLN